MKYAEGKIGIRVTQNVKICCKEFTKQTIFLLKQITMISTILITNLLLLDHTGKTVKLQNNTEYKKKKRLQ